MTHPDDLTWNELTRLRQLWCSTNVVHMLDLPPHELRQLATGDDVDQITRVAAGRVLAAAREGMSETLYNLVSEV